MFNYADLVNKNIYKIVDLLNVSIYWKDIYGNYLGCNKYMLDLLNLKDRANIIGKNDFTFFNNDDAKKIMVIDESVIKGTAYHDEESVILANGEGKNYITDKTPLLDDNGKIIGLLGISMDITNIKHNMETEKQQVRLHEEQKIRQIIDLVDASIYWKDKDGRYLGCNKYVLNIAGVSSIDEIRGKTDFDLLWKNDAPKLREIDNLVMNTATRYEGEEVFAVANKADTKIVVLTVKNQLLDEEGNVIGIVGTSLEITAQKEAEKLKIESEKQKAAIQAQEEFKVIIDEFNHILQKHKFSVLNRNLGVKNNLDTPDKEAIVLNKREQWILYCLSLNKSPKEIALIIGILEKKEIAPATIQAIITKQLYVKFGVYGVSNLIEKASILKLIPFSLEP